MTKNNWQIKKLGEVCKLKNGFAFKSDNYLDNGIPVIRISDIKDGLIVPRNTVYVSEDSVYDNYIINENEIIVAMSGATTGKFGIYKSKEKAYQNQRVGKFDIIDKKQLDNNFLLHQLHSLKRQIEKDAYGGAQPNISSKKIEEMEIVLPPLETQHAIVSKIEELFSELDKGIAELKTAQQQLKTYRQSVLKSAFEGKLTNENVKNGELPDGWEMVKFNDFSKLQRGYDLPLSKIIDGEFPVITSAGINGYHNDFKAKGPCLTTGRSGSVGNINYVEVEKYWPHNTVLYVKDFCENYPKFVYYFYKQFNFKSFSASTAVPTLDRKQLFNENVKRPPLKEQHQIVQEIESRLSVADKMEQSIQESLQKAEALRQSILKKAFSGELV
ncbi:MULTISPECIES: restriction endonuclease subunit S [unclassified Chryseobacterium]|uniref:restriction endonuclease subunit S n=1 Tax=unclassified Chryseobacterium TaxID=2593645 RepID=UPI0030194EA8